MPKAPQREFPCQFCGGEQVQVGETCSLCNTTMPTTMIERSNKLRSHRGWLQQANGAGYSHILGKQIG